MALVINRANDPAFPPPGGGSNQGITIRDYFAATALVGLATAFAGELGGRNSEIAAQAYGLADAMVKARETR